MTNFNDYAFNNHVKIKGTNKDDVVKARVEGEDGKLTINTKKGDDDVSVYGFGGETKIETGKGNDSVSLFNDDAINKLYNGKGDDENYIYSDFCENIIKTGKGNDHTEILGHDNKSTIDNGSDKGNDENIIAGYNNETTISNGKGDDTNKIFGFNNTTDIKNGKGHDFNIVGGSNNTTNIDMGKGDDVTVVKSDGFGNVTTIEGGKGNDTVVLEGNYQVGDTVRENGKTFLIYSDDKGNVVRVANDVENVHVQPSPQPTPPIPPMPPPIPPMPPPIPPMPPPPPVQPTQGPGPVEAPQYADTQFEWPEFNPNNLQGVMGFLSALGDWFSQIMQMILNPTPVNPVAANETGTITGDPHFMGGDGGKYDVQGEAGKTYSLLSDANLQFNGTFEAWGSGGATVVGETGLTVAGPNGMSAVTFNKDGTAKINGQELEDGQTVQLADGGTAVKEGNTLTVTTAEGYVIKQTAMPGGYINTEVKTGENGVAADGYLPGGLLGQTFDPDNEARNGAKGAGAQGEGAIEGNVTDYEVGSLVPQPVYPGYNGMTPNKAIDILINNIDIFDTAAGIGRKDNIIGKQDLEAIMNNPNIDPELKAAAEYLLENEAVFNSLDRAANRGGWDQKIGLNDLKAAKESGMFDNFDYPQGFDPNNMSMGDAAKILAQNFEAIEEAAGKGGNDHIIGKQDLEAIVNSEDLPPHIRMAAQYMLNNPAVYNAIDVAANGGRMDGLVSMSDLNAFLQRHPAQF